MAFTALTTAETDAKSPIDDRLWEKVKENFDDLNSRVILAGAAPFILELQGKLQYMGRKRSIAFGLVTEEFTPSRCRYMLKKSGTSGQLGFDLRKHTAPKTPITAISHQYSASTSSISQTGTALSTQSIARAATQIATQSITHAKAAKNVQSIIGLGSNLWLYNLNTALDSDTVIGDGITFAGCTSGGNNGTFTIVDVGRSGVANVVVSNASGVAQTSAAGTAQVKIMSYNFTNPVDPFFTAGYSHLFAAHSSAANDGTLLVYAINNGGNSVWVKNNSGVVQAGVAGSVDTNLWKFNFSAPVSTTNYVVGEAAKTSGHTSGGNNQGALPILAVNSGGNNLVLYNTAGVAQGGAVGSVNTNRWNYNMPSDPTSQVSVGYYIYASGHTNAANDGTFQVKEVQSTLLVIYNTAGVTQGSAVGTVATTRKLISFSSDQSAAYTTNSYIEMQGCVDSKYNYLWSYSPLRVVEINRGGGANYNVVVDMNVDSGRASAAAQSSPAGYVQVEMKSIFNTAPTLANDLTSVEPNQNAAGTSTDLIATPIAANTPIMLYVTQVPGGDPQDLTILIR